MRKEKVDNVLKAIRSLKQGGMVVVVDNPHRENQGDCVFAATKAKIGNINFLMQQCKGMICTPIAAQHAARLDLSLMVAASAITEPTQLRFTVTVDARSSRDFGVSARDILQTVRLLASPSSKHSDFVRPGHVFPILEAPGGIYRRQGHTEATLALLRLAGLPAVGVLSEILTSRGTPARRKDLTAFVQKHNLVLLTIDEIITYLKHHPLNIENSAQLSQTSLAALPTRFGKFNITVYRSLLDGREHAALSMGDLSRQPLLTRIHSQCLTGDTFGSQRCDCRQQFEQSMRLISESGRGIVLYLNQEGRGIGLSEKIEAYSLQEKGYDTVEANHILGHQKDTRDYLVAAQILTKLGVKSIILLTNNPAKTQDLVSHGIKVSVQPLEISPTSINRRYLETKKKKLGHLLSQV